MRVLLVMRNTYAWNGDHIDTLRQFGLDICLATSVTGADQDPRFIDIVPIPHELNLPDPVALLVAAARQRGIATALTFYEADVVLTSLVNAELGRRWACPEADMIARDKRRQRDLLTKHGIPAPRSIPVRTVDDGRWQPYFLANHEPMADSIALLEEFLPGKEVSLDGVALFGRFELAAVTDKLPMPGPYFEEDFYTLPCRDPQEEPELAALCQAIVDALEVSHCLLNAEFRKDAQGRYRVVEFATRFSGGQNYRNVRDVYSLDPEALFANPTVWSANLVGAHE